MNFSSIGNKVFCGFYGDRAYRVDTFMGFNISDLHDTPMIYAIVCLDKNLGDPAFIYIGSSKEGLSRNRGHFSRLRSGRHENRILQGSYDKRGGQAFSAVVIEYVTEENQFEREQNWLDFFKDKFGRESVYNISNTTGAPPSLSGSENGFYGKKHSAETKMKVAESNRRRDWSPESKKIILSKRYGREYIPKPIKEKLPPRIFKIINSDGDIEEFSNMTHFAKSKGLSNTKIWEVMNGRITSYKGYRKYTPGNIGVKFIKCHLSDDEREKKRAFGESDENRDRLRKMSEEIQKTYAFINPQGDIVIAKNILKFARENKLDASALSKLAKGKVLTHKGWRSAV